MTEATTSPNVAPHFAVDKATIDTITVVVARVALVAALGLIGLSKFTAGEAAGIQPLLQHSPLFSWMYSILSVQAVSNLFGVAELTTVVLILLRPVSPRTAMLGGAFAIVTFLSTLTFLFSTPGAIVFHGLAVLGEPGAFLIKDLALLTASLVVFGDAVAAGGWRRSVG